MEVPTHMKRIEGLDFARALSLYGMFIVNFTVITGSEDNGSEWFAWFMNLFQGRASATFVLLAGIGISLMTRKARDNSSHSIILEQKITIWKRSLFLLMVGLLLYLAGWTGDILHYYGVYMFLASFFIVASKRVFLGFISLILLLAQILQIKLDYLKGWDPIQPFMEYQDFWTAEGFVRNLFFNGYHPIFPWVCFFLIGMIVGRLDIMKRAKRKRLLITSFLVFILIEITSKVLFRASLTILDAESAEFLFQTGPIPPNMFYVISNGASAIIVIILSIYFCERFATHWFSRAMIKTGQMTFTHYVSHVFIGIGFLALLNRLENQTLLFSFLFSSSFFIGSILFSIFWTKKFQRGPIEWLMRRITG